MFRKIAMAMMAAAMTVCVLAIPAAAETFTSDDGVFSIELPDENWKEMTDPTKWLSFSDGGNVITVEHLSNGEKLPEMTVADSHYVDVYQAVFSTQNEVFIITGSVLDAAKIPDVANAIMSSKVLKYDTKLAVKSDAATASDFSIVPMDETWYVNTESLNVRTGCSTTSQIIGTISYGESVKVTGQVQKDGKDFGWLQIAFGGANGYVSSGFMTKTAPDSNKTTDAAKTTEKANNAGITYTGNVKTIYDANGNAVTVYEALGGNWYDTNGNEYYWIFDYTFSNGSQEFTVNQPVVDSDRSYATGNTITVYWLNGNAETLTEYSDGSLYSSSWISYVYAGGGAYAGADGTTLYEFPPELTTGTEHGLSSEGSNRPVYILGTEDGNYYDTEGTQYFDQGNGTYVDENGDVFDVEW